MSDTAARDIRYSLTDARALCEKLGLLAGKNSFSRQAGGLLIRCPWHEDRSPSCSVRRGQDGTLAVRCHACGATGDALSLVAEVHGLSLRGDDFRQVLIAGAELAGLHALVTELETGHAPAARPKPIPRPEPEPERDYPPAADVEAFWAATEDADADARAWAESRSLDPKAMSTHVDGVAHARSLPDGDLPRWASYRGASWRETGHRLVVPVYDYAGNLRSVRAIRVVDGDSPKRLPPSGHRAAGLVQACAFGIAMLRGSFIAKRVLILEGEPDFLTWALMRTVYAYARLGITSGSWTQEIASRIPPDAKVFLHTHVDEAGDKYAEAITKSLPKHELFRWKEAA